MTALNCKYASVPFLQLFNYLRMNIAITTKVCRNEKIAYGCQASYAFTLMLKRYAKVKPSWMLQPILEMLEGWLNMERRFVSGSCPRKGLDYCRISRKKPVKKGCKCRPLPASCGGILGNDSTTELRRRTTTKSLVDSAVLRGSRVKKAVLRRWAVQYCMPFAVWMLVLGRPVDHMPFWCKVSAWQSAAIVLYHSWKKSRTAKLTST